MWVPRQRNSSSRTIDTLVNLSLLMSSSRAPAGINRADWHCDQLQSYPAASSRHC